MSYRRGLTGSVNRDNEQEMDEIKDGSIKTEVIMKFAIRGIV